MLRDQSEGEDIDKNLEVDTKPKQKREFEINMVFEPGKVDRDFPNNRVMTTNYTKLNFIPKNLFQ